MRWKHFRALSDITFFFLLAKRETFVYVLDCRMNCLKVLLKKVYLKMLIKGLYSRFFAVDFVQIFRTAILTEHLWLQGLSLLLKIRSQSTCRAHVGHRSYDIMFLCFLKSLSTHLWFMKHTLLKPIVPPFFLYSKTFDLHWIKYTRIGVFFDPYFPYKDRIFNFLYIRENMDQKKTIVLHILCSDTQHQF